MEESKQPSILMHKALLKLLKIKDGIILSDSNIGWILMYGNKKADKPIHRLPMPDLSRVAKFTRMRK